ncbi:MAG: hypothetical protein KC646_04225 [Candidatus Cloacimonetes bacterium]|nr:hypothetical protein [Candidatus Cloacimonadota bacterium]
MYRYKINQIIALGKELQGHLDKISANDLEEFQRDLDYVKAQVRQEMCSRDTDYRAH